MDEQVPTPLKSLSRRYEWDKLKAEFIAGDIPTIRDFFREKKISLSNIHKSHGWAGERNKFRSDALMAATQRAVQKDASSIFEVRERQARLARFLQLKGAAKLKEIDPDSAEDARKLVVSGMEQERRALGMEGGGSQNLTQINIGPKTNLDKIVETLDYEGLLGLIAELRRERARRPGTTTAKGSSGEILEGQTS